MERYGEDYGIIPYAENLLKNSTEQITDSSLAFLAQYLSKNIGKWVKTEHLIGDKIVTHIGKLINVGIDYMVLRLEGNAVATVVCNIKDIRFITIIYDKNTNFLK
ncbi:MAG: hypothetical protein E7568_05765 [Ruminococcaceae bacterium]|nr:hypothetical protein [Oscillospiraceae bacterium]